VSSDARDGAPPGLGARHGGGATCGLSKPARRPSAPPNITDAVCALLLSKQATADTACYVSRYQNFNAGVVPANRHLAERRMIGRTRAMR
jgi:hypothetical protein